MKDIKSFINESIDTACADLLPTPPAPVVTRADFIERTTSDWLSREFNNRFGLGDLHCRKVDNGLYIVTGSPLTRNDCPSRIAANYPSLQEFFRKYSLCAHLPVGAPWDCSLYACDGDEFGGDRLSDNAVAICRDLVKDNDYIILADPSWHDHDDE